MRLIKPLAALLFLLIPAALADSHRSPDPQVNLARQQIEDRQYLPALATLRQRLTHQQTRQHRHDVLFLIGLAAARQSQQRSQLSAAENSALLKEAIAAFHEIISDNPTLTRVRLELAQAFFLNGQDALAKHHFSLVLAARPPPAMAQNINRFLLAMRARKRWNGHFSLSIAPSTNINSGTDNQVIYLFNLPFDIDDSSRRKSGTGLLLQGGVEYQRPLTDKTRWLAGIDTWHNEYRGGDFDSTKSQLRAGVRFFLPAKAEVKLQLLAGNVWTAQRREYRYWGLSAAAHKRLSDRVQPYLSAAWEKRHHRISESSGGHYSSYRLGAVYFPSARVQANTRIGLSADRPHRASGRSDSRHLRQDATLHLPRGWQLSGGAQWGRRKYQTPSASVPGFGKRRDRQRLFQLGILNSTFTIGGFSPQLTIAREEQDSNSVINQYQRNRLELSFKRQF